VTASYPALARAVVGFYRSARRDLPWRQTSDPYAVWVSEIMLQQTRVATVIPYFTAWMTRFPTVSSLARASLDEVLPLWSGLGYYSRARNLHRGAQEVVATYRGQLPDQAEGLRLIPGIGAYTAGAIASIAYCRRAPLVDGNVARVLARVFALPASIKHQAGQRQLWELATSIMQALPDRDHPGDLNQGLMELGATVCTPRNPGCGRCPLASMCQAHQQDRTDEFPVLPARKKKSELTVLRWVALWVVHRRRVLLARRRPGGLFGGLWELPSGQDAAAAAAAIGARLDAVGTTVARHQQVLSHRQLHVHAVHATLGGSLPRSLGKLADSSYDALRWQPLAATTQLGLSAATSAIIATAKDTPWSSTPKPSTSSSKVTKRSSVGSRASATTPTTKTSPRPRRGRRAASTSSSTTSAR
jgi:A/G-specific adenine glycosylase